jgi:hypothetical protein
MPDLLQEDFFCSSGTDRFMIVVGIDPLTMLHQV